MTYYGRRHFKLFITVMFRDLVCFLVLTTLAAGNRSDYSGINLDLVRTGMNLELQNWLMRLVSPTRLCFELIYAASQ